MCTRQYLIVILRFNEFKRIVGKDGKKNLTMVENFLGGMTAGCFSTILNNPLDVVMDINLCIAFKL